MRPEVESIVIGAKEYRRCGWLPDLFISQDGELLKADFVKPRLLNGYPVHPYRGVSMSMRTLVADAWLPEWRNGDMHLRPKDGNPRNYALENLELVERRQGGRPPARALQEAARLYNTYLLYPHPVEIAVHEKISLVELIEAVRIFDEDLAMKMLPQG